MTRRRWAAREKPLVAFFVDLSYKRRVFEVLLDVVLITLSYYWANVLLFGPMDTPAAWGLFLMLAGSRAAFRLFRRALPSGAGAGARRVLIYGAGDGGELMLREIRNNDGLRYTPVGFIDDDRLKQGKTIHGLRVFKGNGDLRDVCARARADEVLLSSSKFSEDRVRQIAEQCREARVVLRRMRIQIDTLDGED